MFFIWNYKIWIRSIELCNKSSFKKATGVDTLLFAETFDLATLKSEADKLDVS